MKIKNKIIAGLASALLLLGIGVVSAPAASAGDGYGRICNSSASVQYATSSLDYLGRWGHYGIPPGQCRGGSGADMDAVFVPGGRVSQVTINGQSFMQYNQCGRGGFWLKVWDLGGTIRINRC